MTKLQWTATVAGAITVAARTLGKRWGELVKRLVFGTAIALLAVLVPVVPAQAQIEPPFGASVEVLNRLVVPGQIGQVEVQLSPAPTVETEVTVHLHTSNDGGLATIVDLERSGFSSEGFRTMTFAPGQSVAEVGVHTLATAADPSVPYQILTVNVTTADAPYRRSGDTGVIQVGAGTGVPRPVPNSVLPEGVLLAAFEGPAAVTTVPEGQDLLFGVFTAEPAPTSFFVTVLLSFSAGGASVDDLDLADSGYPTTATPAGIIVQVTMPAGVSGVQVRLPTKVDAETEGIEQFTAELNGYGRDDGIVRTPPKQASVEPVLLTIQDPGSVVASTGRSRTVLLNAAATGALPEVEGPLVAGAIIATPTGDSVWLRLPPALRVWLSPTSSVHVKQGGMVLATTSGAPASIVVSPQGSTELTFEGRLRNGAAYRETISLPAPD